MTPTPHAYASIVDVPDLSAFGWPDAPPDAGDPEAPTPPTSRIQVAKAGTFKHPRYGTFTINKQTFDAFIANFAAGIPTDRLPMDFDHEPDYGGSSRACGWITDLEADGDSLYAHVEWTWAGAYAIREREYAYISPTWHLTWTDDAGEKRGPTFLAAALTNRPYFTRMAAVSLAESFSRDQDPTLAIEEPADEDAEIGRIVAADMTTFATIAPLLKLSTDATEDQITAAITTLVAQASNTVPDGHVTIAASALTELQANQKVPAGHTVVKASVYNDLEAKAAKADRYEAELGDTKFENAFNAALAEGRVTPAQKDSYRRAFQKDPENGLELIDGALPQVVTAARGDGGRSIVADTEPGAGVDADRHELDRKVRSYMRAHSLREDQYLEALDEVVAQGANA